MKVSILCITYNHEHFIKKTIESFLMQQCNFDFEIIIGEDKSSDNTALICKEYAQRYPDKIKLVCNNPNLGMMPNFISTFERCTGEYIALCEGDDYWTDPKKLQKQIDFLDSNKDFSLCFHSVTNDINNVLEISSLNIGTSSVTDFNQLQINNYISTCSVVFRNTIEKFPEWYNTANPGDYPLFLMIVGKYSKIKFFNEPMAAYRIHQGGIWSMSSKVKNEIIFLEILYKSMLEFDLDKGIVANKILLTVADNIYLNGLKFITFKKYMFYLFNLYSFCMLNFRQRLFILTCYFRFKFNF